MFILFINIPISYPNSSRMILNRDNGKTFFKYPIHKIQKCIIYKISISIMFKYYIKLLHYYF